MAADWPLRGRATLVTGGGTGIGAAISEHLAELGAAVAVHQRTPEKTTSAIETIRAGGGNAEPVAADLRTLEGCATAVQGCIDAFGRLDILVNNAAITGPGALTPILELDDERLQAILAVNLAAVIRCSQLAARGMPAGGVIVNVGSVAGYAAQPGCAVYVATKSALIGFTRALALDLAERGIRAIHIAPGDVETATSDSTAYRQDRSEQRYRRLTPLGRRGTPREIAALVGFVCTDDASFVTGSSIVADGGFLAY
jgi:3-oxoacyl-[acyl-carrier protein] reductase